MTEREFLQQLYLLQCDMQPFRWARRLGELVERRLATIVQEGGPMALKTEEKQQQEQKLAEARQQLRGAFGELASVTKDMSGLLMEMSSGLEKEPADPNERATILEGLHEMRRRGQAFNGWLDRAVTILQGDVFAKLDVHLEDAQQERERQHTHTSGD